MSEIINIDDHMAYTCECGSVHFNLLRSGKIECSNCQKVNNNWYTDDENFLMKNAIAHIVMCDICHKKYAKGQSDGCPYCEIARLKEVRGECGA